MQERNHREYLQQAITECHQKGARALTISIVEDGNVLELIDDRGHQSKLNMPEPARKNPERHGNGRNGKRTDTLPSWCHRWTCG